MQRVDDTDTRLVYSPPDAWFLDQTELAVKEWNFTTHVTLTAGSEMEFEFNGTEVELYGTISNNVSTVPVSNSFFLDDEEQMPWSADVAQREPVFNAKMFSVRELQDGPHRLLMRTTVDNSETRVDFVQFRPSSSSTVTTSPPQAVPTTITASGTDGAAQTVSPGVIAAITTVIVAAFLLLVLCVVVYRRTKRRRYHAVTQKVSPEQDWVSVREDLGPEYELYGSKESRGAWDRVVVWITETQMQTRQPVLSPGAIYHHPTSPVERTPLTEPGAEPGTEAEAPPSYSGPPSHYEGYTTRKVDEESHPWLQNIYSRDQFYDYSDKKEETKPS